MSHIGPIPGHDVQVRYRIAPELWREMDPCERALFRMAYAADVWHVEEEPRGSNSGAEVERVQRLAGTEKGAPWCASIWTAYLIDSGVDRAALPELAASVHGWGEWAAGKGRILDKPARGCAGLIYHSASTGHLVTIASVGRGTVETISGNTNNDGSREGYGVFRKVYPISAFRMFVDCHDLA